MAGTSGYDVRMGKQIGLVAVAALLLTGCASTDVAAEAVPKPTDSPMTSPKAAPLKAASDQPGGSDTSQTAYLEMVKENWYGELPGDEELVSAGMFACEQYPMAEHYTEITAVQGEDWQAQDNNLRVVVSAGRTLCPEFDPSA